MLQPVFICAWTEFAINIDIDIDIDIDVNININCRKILKISLAFLARVKYNWFKPGDCRQCLVRYSGLSAEVVLRI